MQSEIKTDGITVWVNGASGECLGRFGRMGIDVHATLHDQEEQEIQCLFCTHAPVTQADWGTFRQKMLELHGVQVNENYCPVRFRAQQTPSPPPA